MNEVDKVIIKMVADGLRAASANFKQVADLRTNAMDGDVAVDDITRLLRVHAGFFGTSGVLLEVVMLDDERDRAAAVRTFLDATGLLKDGRGIAMGCVWLRSVLIAGSAGVWVSLRFWLGRG